MLLPSRALQGALTLGPVRAPLVPNLLLCLAASSALAASAPPPVALLPERIEQRWSFDSTNDFTDPARAPIWDNNVSFANTWSGRGVRLHGPFPAILKLPAVRPGGQWNFPQQAGTLRLWFAPDWSSASLGGQGPRSWARLLEAGGAEGCWTWHFDPEGNRILLTVSARGVQAPWLAAPVAFESGVWHQLALTYSPQHAALYVDGVLRASDSAPPVFPDPQSLAGAGFLLGSDAQGGSTADGVFDEVVTFKYPCGADELARNWQALSPWSSGLAQADAARSSLRGSRSVLRSVAGSSYSSQTLALESILPPGGGGGGGGSNSFVSTLPSWADSSCTNGPLVIPTLANGALTLNFSFRPAGVTYDLAFATHLGVSDAGWQWLAEIPPLTNSFVVTNTSQSALFFRLIRVIDLNSLTPSLYVAPRFVPGADGSLALPFPSLSAAIIAATNDSVIVALPGLYEGRTNTSLSFGGKRLALVSERGWENTLINCAGATNGRGFVFTSALENHGAIVAGFTLFNASNSAVYCAGQSSPVFANCAFQFNTNRADGGAAFDCSNGLPLIVNCRFNSNSALTSGGAILARGTNGRVEISHSTFYDNRRISGGGTLCATSQASIFLNNSIVWSSSTSLGAEIVTNGARAVTAGSRWRAPASTAAPWRASPACAGSRAWTWTARPVWTNPRARTPRPAPPMWAPTSSSTASSSLSPPRRSGSLIRRAAGSPPTSWCRRWTRLLAWRSWGPTPTGR